MTSVRAVVDCGSNSTRLWLRADPGVPPTHRERVTRLGQGVDANGRLDPEALERTLATVGDYAADWTVAGVDASEVVVIATSAVRDAANRDDYVDGVVAATGVTPTILSGDQEAAASFVGATSQLTAKDAGSEAHATQVVVVDIGGGSTELVTGEPGTTTGLRGTSTQLGTVRLTERCLADDPPTPAQVADARDTVRNILGEGLAHLQLDPSRPVIVVAVAGTATTLAALDLAQGEDTDADVDDIDGHVIPSSRLSALAVELASRSAAQRLEMGPLHPGRADVIAGGAIILDELVGLLGGPDVTVSVRDVMDGVAALWPFD